MSFPYNFCVLVLVMLSFGIQEFMPVIEFAQQARVLLPVVFFFCCSLTVSFPMMLMLALLSGFVWDARHLPYKQEDARPVDATELTTADESELNSGMGELPLGYSILLFGVAGALMQGIRPLFKRGRWELPVFMVGIATFIWLLVEFLLISFLRGSFEFQPELWTKLITCSLLGMLVAPLLLFMLHTLAGICHYEVRNDGLVYRYYGS